MAGIPQNFQAISNVLANYDFTDIVAGTGLINLYAGDTVDTNLLSNNTFYADDVYTESTLFSEIAATKRLDIDFDVTINRPLILKGKVVVNVPIRVYSNIATWVSSVYAIITLRKWDGATETDIATNTSSATSVTGVGYAYKMTATDLDIPLTMFKIGETLRLTIEVWSSRNSTNGGAQVALGHDPMSRTTGWDTTGAVPSKLVFQCPVRLNL